MYTKRLFLLFIITLICAKTLFAQSPVSVNPVTGTAGVNIPIYTLTSGQVSVPISLSYAATGVKVLDVENSAGMGWQLNAASFSVSRMVRGIPDDCSKDSLGNSRMGWMLSGNSAATFVTGFTPANSGTTPTCAQQAADTSAINANVPYYLDTEPDIFYVNAPGLSCQLVYSRDSMKFFPLVYQDMKISYATIGGTGNNATNIKSFTITTDQGITYTFAAYDKVKQTTVNGSASSYFYTKYQQYQHSIIYSDTRYLTSISDPYGNGVSFKYGAPFERDSTDPVVLYFNGSTVGVGQYKVQQAVTSQLLDTIGTFNTVASYPNQLILAWQPTNFQMAESGQSIISTISGFGRVFQFNYNQVISTGSPTNFKRNFLASYTESGCSSPVNYQFSYIGQTGTTTFHTTLPDSASTLIDYWGYASSAATGGTLVPTVYVLNPIITTYPRYVIGASTTPSGNYTYLTLGNNNRSATTASVTAGTLNQITYATGGSTTLVYEPNTYYDVPTLSSVSGGGIRVQQITDAPASGASNSIVRTYNYNNPATGITSGEPITLPQYAFTIPNYNGTDTGRTTWKNATAFSAYDLSSEDHTIMYAYVTVSQTGAGSTQNNYSIAPTYWDNGFGTVELVAKYTCPGTYSPIQNYANAYPFIPNLNHDQRGLLIKSTSFNTTGTEVSESNYTYTSPTTSLFVQAFKGDNMGSSSQIVKSYNIYNIGYNTSSFIGTVNTKVFDSPTLSQARSSTVSYTYGSAYHKLLTQQQTTNSDGSIIADNYSYAKDYTATAGSVANPNITAIYNLIQQNHNAPVESHRQYTPAGGTLTNTSAALTLYRDTTLTGLCVVPSQQFKWSAPNGNSFNPMIISGNTLTKNPDYLMTAKYQTYDSTAFPLTVEDNYKNIQTTVLDHFSGKPTATFKNAAYNQIAFSDFDTDPTAPPSCAFTKSGSGSFSPVGSHAGNAAGIASTQTYTSGTLSINSLAQNYIFSIWINAATAGTLILTLTGITTHPTISYLTGGWQYYELSIPVGTLSSSFTVSFTTSQNISVDDILFYPDCAEAATVTYDATAHYKLAATNTNGVSAYFTNDIWGRPLLQMDQDKNIVGKNSYFTPADVQAFVTPVNTYSPSSVTTITPVTFASTLSGDPCVNTGMSYTWNFGDGAPNYTSYSPVSAPHTYTAVGSYTVTLTASSPFLGTKTAAPITVVVVLPTATVTESATGISGGAFVSIVFTGLGGAPNYTFTSTTPHP